MSADSLHNHWFMVFTRQNMYIDAQEGCRLNKFSHKMLSLSTTIVREKPKRSQMRVRAAAKTVELCSDVSSAMANDVMPHAAIK